jgi:hypothetical protein
VLLMGVPGPCTSFNGVSAPTVEASADASRPGSEGGCDAGIQLDWAKGDGAFCQNHANEVCCSLLSQCSMGHPSECPDVIHCINQCQPPRSTAPDSCAAGCVGTDLAFDETLTKFRTLFFGPDGNAYPDTGVNQCRWVELSSKDK